MKNRKVHIILPLVFLFCISAFAQDAIMFDQNVMKQEFMNPAYNSFKDHVSINLLSRHQWFNKLSGAPETYAANVYYPINLSGLGVGVTAVRQSIGLRQKVLISGSFSHNLRVSTSDFLAFGYGVGVQYVSYDRDKIITYPDVNFGGLDLNSSNMTASLGLFFFDPLFFVGLSSNFLVNSKKSGESNLIPGIDFTSGFMYQLSDIVLIRPDMVLKFYPVKMHEVENGKLQQSKAAPILDLGINFLLIEKFWIGTSHRIRQAQTFSLGLDASESFKFGYTFEVGIGQGINQFNSHGIHLTWNFVSQSALKGFSRSGRYNMNGLKNSHLYR